MPSWMRAALALFVVGFGANQFAAMLPVYRAEDGATDAQVTALFGAYAIGLIPALLVVGPLSDRLGRRRVIRPVLVLTFVATVVLMVGGHSLGLLLVGRLLAGVASGAAFAPGTAWVRELSTDDPSSGARRAAIALTAGFGSGPFVTGIIAQWGPAPTVLPYTAHLVLTVLIALIAWNTHESARVVPDDLEIDARRVRTALTSSTFVRQVVPTAPWVFGCATLAFATQPAIVDVPGPEIATIGALVALTLGTGILLQPYGRRLDRRTTLASGLAAGVTGFAIATMAAATDLAGLVVVACVAFGAAYGLILVAGLRAVEEVTPPSDLATVNAVFYSLTYVGFAGPYLATLLLRGVSGVTAMLLIGGVMAVCAVVALTAKPVTPR